MFLSFYLVNFCGVPYRALFLIYIDNINSQEGNGPYQELTQIEVCSITSDGSDSLDGIFDGTYSMDGMLCLS